MLTEALTQEIQNDIAAFSDPGTPVHLSGQGELRWTRSRREHSARLVSTGVGFPDVVFGDRQYQYTAFLASEALADLRDLAVSVQNQIPPIDHFTIGPAADRAPTGDPLRHDDAAQLIVRCTADPAALPFGATRVLFVHGNAGVGKTSLLRHVTRQQAERYLRGETGTLLLYLDAQGKGLTQLEDVMARALQDWRARFTYHCLAPLTRRRCIVPIVDGFDELIGPSSAREAFNNLAQFLSQLNCEGALIVSSRSAFIDYATLHESASQIAAPQGLSYEIYPVELLEWPATLVLTVAGRRLGGDVARTAKVEGLLETAAGTLIRKPFFLTHVCSILEEGGDVRGEDDLVRQVVDAALSREAGKLCDRRGKPILSAAQHRGFCEAVADEMWWQESPELDIKTIRTIAELFAEQNGLGPQDAKTLGDRSIAHGLLTITQGAADKRAFEHELFRFEFQVGRLTSALLGSEADVRDFLVRRELAPELIARVRAYRAFTGAETEQVVSRVSAAARRSRGSGFAASNGGSLAAAMLEGRQDLPEGGRLDSLYLRYGKLGSCILKRWSIRDCVLERVDLTEAQLIGCQLGGTTLVSCCFGEGTRFDGTAIDVEAVGGVEISGVGETYDPRAIRAGLVERGAVVLGEEPASADLQVPEGVEGAIEVVERLLQHARGHFYMLPHEHWVQNRLTSHREWPRVEQLLRKHRLLADVQLTKSGRHETFWRLSAPPEAIWRGRTEGYRGSSMAVAAFWAELLTPPPVVVPE